jgi:hypothetical protein
MANLIRVWRRLVFRAVYGVRFQHRKSPIIILHLQPQTFG